MSTVCEHNTGDKLKCLQVRNIARQTQTVRSRGHWDKVDSGCPAVSP